jgi:aspartate racemase
MKTIGLIGGMSWESSLEYYRIINERMKQKLGGLHSAKSLMYSVDFEEIEKLQQLGKWGEATKLMIDAAQRIERGGADFVVICTNTMHMMAEEMQKNIKIPLLHIVDATAEKIRASGNKKVGLLGTKFTMEEHFYKGRLIEKYNLEVIIPDEAERRFVHDVIYKELCLGSIQQNSKNRFKTIIDNLSKKGAQAVILGCTEIPLLIKQEDVSVPLLDTTRIHAESAVDFALAD